MLYCICTYVRARADEGSDVRVVSVRRHALEVPEVDVCDCEVALFGNVLISGFLDGYIYINQFMYIETYCIFCMKR